MSTRERARGFRLPLAVSTLLTAVLLSGCIPDDGYRTYNYCPCDYVYGACELDCSCDPDCAVGPPISYCACDQVIGVCEAGCSCDIDCPVTPGPTPDGGPPSSPTGGYDDRRCTDSSQCPTAGQACLVNDPYKDSWCAGDCKVDSDCGDDGCCLPSDMDGNFCFPPRYCGAPSSDGGVPADLGVDGNVIHASDVGQPARDTAPTGDAQSSVDTTPAGDGGVDGGPSPDLAPHG